MGSYRPIREPFRLRHALIPAVCLVIMVYFAYHGVQGRHGLISWLGLSHEIEGLEADLARVTATRERLESHVALLRPESLDPDLLDERARGILGLANRDELTIFRDPD